jgi:hypothetical protein
VSFCSMRALDGKKLVSQLQENQGIHVLCAARRLH